MDFKPEPPTDPELKPTESDLVREPAPTSVPEGVLVEYEGMEGSPAHIPAAEGELHQASIKYFEDLEKDFPPKSPIPAGPAQPPASLLDPPSLILPPPTKDSQFSGPTSAGSLQFLGSSSLCSTLLCGSASGFPISSSVLASGSTGSASGHRSCHSTLAC